MDKKRQTKKQTRMKRPSFHFINMGLAIAYSQRSHHPTHKVGCVIASHDGSDIYSGGYNGHESGGSNRRADKTPGLSELIHAECNAAIRCKASKETKKTVYVTLSPCIICAKMLINLGGVKKLFYQKDYRDQRGLKLLKKHGIQVFKFR